MRPPLSLPVVLAVVVGLSLTVFASAQSWRGSQKRQEQQAIRATELAAQAAFRHVDRELAAVVQGVEALGDFHRASEEVEEHELGLFARSTLHRLPSLVSVHRYTVGAAEPQGFGSDEQPVRLPEDWLEAAQGVGGGSGGEARLTLGPGGGEGGELMVHLPLERAGRSEAGVLAPGGLIGRVDLGRVLSTALREAAVGQSPGTPAGTLLARRPGGEGAGLARAGRAEEGGEVHRRATHLPASLDGQVELVFVDQAEVPAPIGRGRAVLLLLAGLAMTLALSVTLATLGSRHRVASELVHERTQALDETSRRLLRSEERFRAIVENSVDGILTAGADGLLHSVNPAGERIFGLPEAELLGRHLESLVPGALAGEGRRWATAQARRPDGTALPIEQWRGRLRLRDEEELLVVVRDISEREAVERLKGEFIGTVSHELRTPLTSILGSLELARDGLLGPLPPEASRMVQIAYDNGEHLLRIINDILDMERLTSGGSSLTLEVLEAGELIERALRTNRGFADRLGVRLLAEPTPPGLRVLGDGERLLQVMTNLLGNAVKFSPEGGLVRVGAEAAGDAIRFWVRDQGPGIAPEFKERIFEPFTQADATDRRAQGGTGLGLSITRSIILAHEGEIGVHSVLGEGATFYFSIPRPPGAP